MAIIKWQDIYEVHVEEIDNQHKKLVSLMDTMAEAMRSGKGKTVVGRVLNELVDYTAYHFASEEEWMRRHQYREYETHKAIHRELTRRAMEMKRTFELGQPLVTAQVLQFLSEWLNKHIIGEDGKIGRALNESAA